MASITNVPNPNIDFSKNIYTNSSRTQDIDFSSIGSIDKVIINPEASYLFGDGSSVSGKELQIAVRLLLNDIKDKYPEEFI